MTLKVRPDRVVALSPSEQGDIECASAASCPEAARGTTLSAWRSPGTLQVEAAVAELTTALHAIARSRNLMALATRLAAQSRHTGLAVAVHYQPRGSSTRQAITPEKVPALRPGDRLIVTLENKGQKSLDVTLLYADARYGISALFPTGAGEINRLEPGSRTEIDDILISDADGVVGIERLFAISVEAEKQRERADFSFLSQPALQDAASRTRGGAGSDDVQAFVDAGFADFATRGTPGKVPGNRTGMQVFTFDVRPNPASRP